MTQRRQSEAAWRRAHDKLALRMQARVDELERQNSVLEALGQIVQAISANLDPGAMYTIATEQIRRFFPLDLSALWVLEEDGRQYRFFALPFLQEQQPQLVTQAGVAEAGTASGDVLLTGTAVLRADWREPCSHEVPVSLFDQGIRSDVILPLRFLGKTLGAFTLNSCQPNAYSERDLPLLRQFADHLAVAVRDAGLLEQLARGSAELERSNAELEQFAHVCSHDLQEPLRTVNQFLRLFDRRHRAQLQDDAAELIDFAVGGAQRMQHLIEDLLEYSRAGSEGEAMEQVDLQVVWDDVLSSLTASVQASGAVVTTDALPTVNGVRAQLSRLLQNLTGNALKHRGEARPRIHLGAERQGAFWELSVADNGPGIDPRYHDSIFQSFTRLAGTDRNTSTGLGLAICKKIVEAHGGRIRVQSSPGAGSTFFFTIAHES